MQRLPASPGLMLSAPVATRHLRRDLLLRGAAWLVAGAALVQLVRTLDLSGVAALRATAGAEAARLAAAGGGRARLRPASTAAWRAGSSAR